MLFSPLFTSFIRRFAWISPFASFAAGYLLLAYFNQPHEITVPSLVGTTAPQALREAAHHNITLRILREKIEPNLPDGTVIQQSPSAGKSIKEYQSLFIILSKQPEPPATPGCIGKTGDVIRPILKKKGIRARVYFLANKYPRGHCFAQYPQANQPFIEPYLTLYLSLGEQNPVVWPDFTGKLVPDALEQLQVYGLDAHIIHAQKESKGHTNQECIVNDQRPLPGSLVYLDEKHLPHIQLQVQ